MANRNVVSRCVLVGSAALLAMLHAVRVFQASISDDAYILYRYAEHLASGQGLVWNIGEPPIEGFTSLLHVWVLAAGRLAGLDLVFFGQLLGVGFAGLSCIAVAWLGWEISGGDVRVSAISAFLLALFPHQAAWARGGLETTTFTALLALALASSLREARMGSGRHRSSVLFFLATLSRPEALGIAVITIGWDALEPHGERGRGVLRRASAWWLYGACLLLLVTWKVLYFGSVVPNTYWAKTGGGIAAFQQGAGYVLRFFRSFGAVNVLLAVVPLLLFPPRSVRKILLLGLCVFALSFHVARVGGDYQYFWRYLVPLLPLLCSLTVYGAIRAWDGASGLVRHRRLAAAVVVGAVALTQVALPSVREILDRPWLLVRPLRLVHDTDPKLFRNDFEASGRLLRELSRPDETIAALAVGALGYYSQRRVMDLMGLNDRILARLPVEIRGRKWVSGHMRGDAREILRRQPDIIVMPHRPTELPNTPPSEQDRRNYPFMADLLKSPEFQAAYRQESHALPDGRWLNFYRREGSSGSRAP